MPVIRKTFPWFVAILFSGMAFFVTFTTVHADGITNQYEYDTYVGSFGGNTAFYTGTTTSAVTLSSVTVVGGNVGVSSSVTFTLRVRCVTNFSGGQATCADTTVYTSATSYTLSAGSAQQFMSFYFNNLQLQSGRQYLVEVLSASGDGLWGTTTYQFPLQCSISGTNYCTGTPYFALNSTINWNALNLSPLPPYLSSTSSVLLGSTTLWGAYSTTTSLIAQCATGNIFGDGLCYALNFIIIPNPNVLNTFFSIKDQLVQHAPFSYISSGASLLSLLYDTATGDIGTTTAVWVYNNGAAHATTTMIDSNADVAAFPLVTTMRDFAGDMLYIVWGASLFFLVIHLI